MFLMRLQTSAGLTLIGNAIYWALIEKESKFDWWLTEPVRKSENKNLKDEDEDEETKNHLQADYL